MQKVWGPFTFHWGVATSIVIPILIGGSSGGDFGFNIPKSTTRMSDDNGPDKLVRRVYVGLAGMDETRRSGLVDDISILG